MRILILITSPIYVRNYLTTEAFSKLSAHDIKILLTEEAYSASTKKIPPISGSQLLKIESSFLRRQLYDYCNKLIAYSLRAKNKTFLFRLRRELIFNLFSLAVVPKYFRNLRNHRIFNDKTIWILRNRHLGSLISLSIHLSRLLLEVRGLIIYCTVVIFSNLRLQSVLTNLYWSVLPIDKGMKKVAQDFCPEITMIPSSVIGYEQNELMRAINRLGSGKTVLLIDNWDNLISKSCFIKKPDYIGVWGRQSFDFSLAIHGFKGSEVVILGTPRFEVYKNTGGLLKEGRTPYDQLDVPYILFAGCAVEFDEIGALTAVSASLESMKEVFPQGTKIVYRPHPWGKKEKNLSLLSNEYLSNVVIDPQIIGSHNQTGKSFLPSLDYYPALLGQALIVICPLSTMILEAALLGKQVVALAHEDGVSLLSPNRLYKNYIHFRGVERISNITIIDTLDDLAAAIENAYFRGDIKGIPSGLDYLLEHSPPSYQDRLAAFVEARFS
jgi:hypothetical protein